MNTDTDTATPTGSVTASGSALDPAGMPSVADVRAEARLAFALELRKRWATELYPRLADDLAAGDATDGAAEGESPLQPWFAWIERGAQKMLWRASMQAADLAADTTGEHVEPLGSLLLDPELELPAWYRDIDIHVQPGGVWSSDRAADVYEFGAKLVMLGDNDDYLFHRLFVDTVLAPDQPTSVVDLGCGFGKSAWAIKRHLPDAHVTGVDLAATLVAKAHRQASALGLDIDWRQADARRTGLPSESVDQVTSTMLLHELPPFAIAEVVGEAARLLRPGGAMHMLDFHLTGDPVRDRAMRDHSDRNNEPFMAMLFDTDVEAICRDAGLVDVTWRAFDERSDGLLETIDRPARSEWHFPWAVLTARKATD